MRAYSMDLRERIVAAVDAGMTHPQVAARFGVSVRTVERLVARQRATGSVAPTEQRHGPAPVKKQRLQAWLPNRLDTAADATLAEHVAAFVAAGGQPVSLASMSRAIASLPADPPGSALTPGGRRRRPGRPLKQRA
jgi:transposase